VSKRRELVIALGSGAFVVPFGALGQPQGKVARVGFLSLNSASFNAQNTAAFLSGMRELGYVEGRNLVIEWRFADGRFERLPVLAAELVQLRVDVIVADPSSAIGAAQKATATIPIVMATTGDPVGNGFVKSLASPGGNITGLSTMGSDTGAKLVDLLRSTIPGLARVAVLVPTSRASYRSTTRSVLTGAQQAGVKVQVIEAFTPQEIETAFATMAREKAGAVIVGTTTFSTPLKRQIAALALKQRLPSMFGTREYVDAGGLMSYGTKLTDLFNRCATYVDKVLRGSKPGDLPVQQPVVFELVVNLRTARAIGLAIPQSVLLRADEVIE
jgi:putative tryptophan/tyrosine transport system substrate-binding protein